MATTDVATTAFHDDIDIINQQLDRSISKAQDFHITLDLIISKIETIQGLVKKGKRIDDQAVDQLLQGSLWTWLFGTDIVRIRKHQRNIRTLDQFTIFIRKLSSNVDHDIENLLQFKAAATNLKETAADLKAAQYKSPERQLRILQASLKRLDQAKQAFERKLLEEKKGEDDITSKQF